VGLAPSELIGVERSLYQGYRSPRRRAEFVAGRRAARRAVAIALDRPKGEPVEIGREPSGSPCVREDPGLRISIAHSSGVAVAVAARFAIGVDLELDAPRPAALARFFLSPRERDTLARAAAPAQQGLLNVLWTRKEAASKVGGWGGRLAFAALDCSGERVTVAGRQIDLRSARAAGYALSVARAIEVR
jgi:phosphopantetheinyl transferase